MRRVPVDCIRKGSRVGVLARQVEWMGLVWAEHVLFSGQQTNLSVRAMTMMLSMSITQESSHISSIPY